MSSVFGKYEKIRRLAQGGMGEVFLARQTGVLDRLAILKALRGDLAKEKEFVEQFLDEARVAATLNHPNIVAIYDVGDWYGTYYIAMEYIAGEDLSKLWYAAAKAGVGLPFQVSVRIVMEAAMGLDHAHRAKDVRGSPLNIVHRDISPQNIMVRADGVTKLVDFGIAKAANKSSRTQAGMVKGKLQYMSPEQVRGEALDGRSDQFSLGIVIWEMCTGRRLFKADTEINTLQKILQNPIPKPSQHVPGFPPELEAIVLRMLERDPARRYNNVGDVAARLKEYLDRTSLQSGEVSVAAFVQQILGKELDERIRDLTPMEPTDGSGRAAAGQVQGMSSSSSASSGQNLGMSSSRAPAPPIPARPIPVALPAVTQPDQDDDGDQPTTVVGPEDRPDRVEARPPPKPAREPSVNGPPSGPTGAFVVRKADGSVVHFQERATLQQWVLDGKLAKDDQLSTDGGRFARLGDDAQLQGFFATAEAAARTWDRAPSGPPVAVHQPPSAHTSTTANRTAAATEPNGEPSEDEPPAPTPRAAAERAAASWANDPQNRTPTTQDPFDPMLPAATGAFHLGSLPTSHTGHWQIGDPVIQDALAKAAADASAPRVDPASMAVVTDPNGRAPARNRADQKRIPVALWALVGVLGSFVAIALVLRLAFPDTLRALKEGDRSSLTHAHAALAATRKDEPATVDALLANLGPLLGEEQADVDADVAAALLQLERWRVQQAATLLQAQRDGRSGIDPAPALALAQKYATRALASAGDDDDAESSWARVTTELVAASLGSDGARQRAAVQAAAIPELADEARADAVLANGLAALTAVSTAFPADAAVDAFDKRPASLHLLVDSARAQTAGDKDALRPVVDEHLKKSPSDLRWIAAHALLGDPAAAGAPGLVDAGTPAVTPAASTPIPPVVPAVVVEETYDSAFAKATKAQKAGHTGEAAKMFRAALTKKPGDSKAELGLSWSQIDLGKSDAAIKGFRNIIAREPAVTEAFFGLGEALRGAGKTTEAIAAYEQYLEVAPSGPDAETAKNAIRALQ